MIQTYEVSLKTIDYRGEKHVFIDRSMTWKELQTLVGEKLFEYGKAEDRVDTVYFFGKRLAAGGQMESHAAEIDFKAKGPQ